MVDKGNVPPSGDLHDYMSIAPYWWPDPSAPDGKPYVRKDGRVNPERTTADYDLSALSRMSADVETLARPITSQEMAATRGMPHRCCEPGSSIRRHG
ncbi:hypothetical protein M2337_002462 [Sphingobium sp. B2D3A]|nr:hypothetical protein [Sphingobium sp. B2D3A]